jgi:hypothetical protein
MNPESKGNLPGDAVRAAAGVEILAVLLIFFLQKTPSIV